MESAQLILSFVFISIGELLLSKPIFNSSRKGSIVVFLIRHLKGSFAFFFIILPFPIVDGSTALIHKFAPPVPQTLLPLPLIQITIRVDQ